MIDNSDRNGILNSLAGSADFLCQNSPLVREIEQTVLSANHGTRAFLLGGEMSIRISNNFKDMIGKSFGRLVVIKRHGVDKWGQATWECLCICGNKKNITGGDLRTGNTKSCGCTRGEKRKTHGKTGTQLYIIWSSMKQRCKHSNKHRYRFYKGIKICEEWNKFENFYKWAESKHSQGLDIDRIDTLKGYYPDNCRFITRKKNAQNKKNCKLWYVKGIVFKSAYDASKYFNVVQSTIVSWCMGKKSGKYIYPAIKNCFAIKKYKEV